MNYMVEHDNKKNVINDKLNDIWTLWAHLPHDTNWDLESYHQISDISDLREAVTLIENIPEKIIKNCMLFLMRKGIYPIWEDPQNVKGGSFSYKINNRIIINTFKNLSYVLLGETVINAENNDEITGISISPKKNFCILKIWLKTCKNTDPNIITQIDGLVRSGCIFKKHISDE